MFKSVAVLLFMALAACGPAFGWGSVAHGLVTTAAVDALPGGLGDFFRENRDALVCYSGLPDSWWGAADLAALLPRDLANPAGLEPAVEKQNHHLDLPDSLGVYGESRDFVRGRGVAPLSREAAMALFALRVQDDEALAMAEFKRANAGVGVSPAGLPGALLQSCGTLPWAVEDRFADLVQAMRSRDWKRSVFLATVLGHYVGDAATPLHTTVNYTGQLHPNPLVKGIHWRFEAGLVTRHLPECREFLARRLAARSAALAAFPADGDVRAIAFGLISGSFERANEVVRLDDECLCKTHASAVESGHKPRRDDPEIYDDAYYEALHQAEGMLLLESLGAAVDTAVQLWGLAWVRAGRPEPPRGRIVDLPLFTIDHRNRRLAPFGRPAATAD